MNVTPSMKSLVVCLLAADGPHASSVGESRDSDSYISAVPLPAAVWLFGSALISFITLSNRRMV
jgi:hypothetical protein